MTRGYIGEKATDPRMSRNRSDMDESLNEWISKRVNVSSQLDININVSHDT